MDGLGLGTLGVEGKDTKIMLAGEAGFVEFLSVEIPEEEMAADLIRMLGEQFFQFVSGVVVIAFLLQDPGEGIAGVGGIGFEFQSSVKGSEGGAVILRINRDKAKGKRGLEISRIDVKRFGIIALRVFETAIALGFDALLKIALSVGAISRNGCNGQRINIARVARFLDGCGGFAGVGGGFFATQPIARIQPIQKRSFGARRSLLAGLR